MLKLIKHDLSEDIDKLKLYSISDLHVGEKNFDEKMFREFVKMLQKDKNAYCILAGDLMNNAIKSSVSDIYEDVMSPHAQKRWLKKELEPIKDKVLAIVTGNHEYRSKKTNDEDIMEDIAEHLGLLDIYTPVECIIKLTFGRAGRNKQMYSIYVTHGSGGGGTPGAMINKIERLSMSVNADIYITGHFHKKLAYKHQHRSVDLIHEKIHERERLFVVASHWAEYFTGYASVMMMQPSAKGSVPIILHSKRKYFEAVI